LGHSPDLVTEEDILDGQLAPATHLIVVGDCWNAKLVPALEKWVQAGGTILATASAGSRDAYGQPTDAFHQLAGLSKVESRPQTTFLRPRMELPHLQPLGTIEAEGWKLPVLATHERVVAAAGTKERCSGMLTERSLGKGKIVYLAAHPGLAFLHAGLQPPVAPDRGPVTHSIPTNWDRNVLKLLDAFVNAPPLLKTSPQWIDARLLRTPKGYLLPLASYTGQERERVTLDIAIKAKSARSAFAGDLKIEPTERGIRVIVPELRYGDILRLE
ncbi:MAG: hypothetical protein SNJ75_18915, partial [Gemmataceae bacterium]